MRTCLNCKYRDIRHNVSKCYQCQETNSFINWRSNLLHTIFGLIVEVLLLAAFVASALCVISSPNHSTFISCTLHALFGGIGFGLSLLGLAYISEKDERRRLENRNAPHTSANR